MTNTTSSRKKKSATYQDQWVSGKVAAAGYRECASRYEIIRAFCRKFERPFTVCDIGANMCYFGLRLTEDFPQCSVMAFEFDHFELREAHVRKNKGERLLLLNRKLTLEDVRILGACCRFDVVLALSVMHHLSGGTFDEWLKALRGLGNHLLAEFATDDSKRVASRAGYRVPPDALVLGYGDSHLKRGARRPIVLLSDSLGPSR